MLVLIAALAAFLLWLLGTAATHQGLDQRLRPGSRKRNAYSRLFLARLLLTLESCQDLIKELVDCRRPGQSMGLQPPWGTLPRGGDGA